LIPDIYLEYRDSIPYSNPKFLLNLLISIVWSALIFYVPRYAFSQNILNAGGNPATLWDASVCTYYTLIIVGTLIPLEDTKYYNFATIAWLIFHVLINLLAYLVYDLFKTGNMVSGILGDSVGNLYFWMVLIATCGIALVPFYLIRSMQFLFGESIINNLNTKNYHKDYQKKKYLKMLEELAKCTRSVMKFKRIFKQGNFEADNFADKRMKEIVDNYRANKKMVKKQQVSSVVKDPLYIDLTNSHQVKNSKNCDPQNVKLIEK
jgi:hypothetical protein